jgi:hypothetical protein
MGGCYLLKYNGGDSGIRIPVLYWGCPLISLSVIRGSAVYTKHCIMCVRDTDYMCCDTIWYGIFTLKLVEQVWHFSKL